MEDRQEKFVRELMPYAVEVSRLTGIDVRLVLAQTAHETDWGKGVKGNAYLGVKGKGQVFTTHEEVGGKLVKMQQSFRMYPSPRGSFLDWAKQMNTNPNFVSVGQAKGISAQISALDQARYATDCSARATPTRFIEVTCSGASRPMSRSGE